MRQKIPPGVWALGFVSLFMDVSSEMIHSLLPVFLVSVLGAGIATVGVIEGIGEGTAAIAKLFSGWLSDRMGARKFLTVSGYGLSALSKPLFALASGPLWVLGARFLDRLGKGVRGAPRDALIGDLTPPEALGAAFGLRQSLDNAGAFAGPLLALLLMALLGNDFRQVFWIAVVPGMLSVAILIFHVREPPQRAVAAQAAPIRWQAWRELGQQFWIVAAIAGVFTLARFSDAFLILRGQSLNLPAELAPMVLIVMNAVTALSAYPTGLISDRVGRRGLLAFGFALLVAADLILAFAQELAVAFVGLCVWGLHLGMTQGLLSALISETAPQALRGTAFGLFNLIVGIAILSSSVIAGMLWQAAGPQPAFLASAAFALLALAISGLLLLPSARRGVDSRS